MDDESSMRGEGKFYNRRPMEVRNLNISVLRGSNRRFFKERSVVELWLIWFDKGEYCMDKILLLSLLCLVYGSPFF